MAIGSALGLATLFRRGGQEFVRQTALIDAQFDTDVYVSDGQTFESRTAFLSAIGAVQHDSAIVLGPILPGDAPELLTNGDFSDEASGWSGQMGGIIAATDGGLQLSAGASDSPSFSRAVAVEMGCAYRFAATYGRLSGSGGAAAGISALANLNGAAKFLPANGNLTPVTEFGDLGAEATTMYVGGRLFVGAGSSLVSWFDDFSLKQVVPFAGYEAGGFAFAIKGRTPASAPEGTTVLFQADGDNSTQAGADNTVRNRVRVAYDSGSGKHLRLSMTFAGNEVVAFDLGVIEFDTEFEIVASIFPNRVLAGLVGRPFFRDTNTSNAIPGIATMRLGRSREGEQWTGSVERVRIFANAMSDAAFYGHAMDDSAIVAWGDSLTSGAGSTGGNTYPYQASLLFGPVRTIINLGIGGQTSTQIAARMNARPILVSVEGNQVPASGGVAVTAKNINVLYNSGNYSGAQTGWLAGVHGNMSTDGAGNWTFTRTRPGEALACPAGSQFTCEIGQELQGKTAWLWLGRNGAQAGYGVEDDIAAAVASLTHERYLVGSVLTSAGDSEGTVATIEARNAALASTYGARFVDVLSALRAAHDGSPGDLEDIAASHVPRSLRHDAVHLNDAGYEIVAASFGAAHVAMEW